MPVHVRPADFPRDRRLILPIRIAVFVQEQGVPLDIEADDRDPACAHALAYAGRRPIGTGRIDLEQGGRIGRVAVLAPYRRAGAGAALMSHFHRVALAHGLTRVWCHAQRAAVPFYERLGYAVASAPFEEAGIEHVTMTKTLA